MQKEKTFHAANANDAVDVLTSLIKLDDAKLIVVARESDGSWSVKAVVPVQ